MFTKKDIKQYANKILIDLTEEEEEKLTSEFESIQKSVELINEIEGIEEYSPMHMVSYVGDIVLRSDIPEETLTKEEILKNCGSIKEECVSAPKVVN